MNEFAICSYNYTCNRKLMPKKKHNVLNKAKELTSSVASGGTGGVFEHRVQSLFVALMLSDGFCPCIKYPWPIAEITLQARPKNYETDDAVVFARNDDTGEQCRLLLNIKRSVAFTKKDKKMSEIIGGAWRDFKNEGSFTQRYDSIALIAGHISKLDYESVSPLLALAKTGCVDAADFYSKITQSRVHSNKSRVKLDVIKHHIKNANEGIEPTPEETWIFLKNFFLISFDMDLVSGVCTSLIKSLIRANSNEDIDKIWGLIKEEVEQNSSVNGTITKSNISPVLKGCFATDDEPKTAIAPSPIKETAALNLIGSWAESSDGDREIIEQLSGVAFADWQSKIREILREVPDGNA